MNTAIQKREPSILDTLYNSKWTPEVVDVVRKLRVPRGCTDEEFFVYLMQCQQSGLNPLLGHAHCVPRRTNIGSKENPKWVTNHVFQPTVEGMRARAGEFPDFDGIDSAPIYKKDKCRINKGTGEVDHETAPTDDRGQLIGAWARLRRKDGTVTVLELPASARSGTSDFWVNDRGSMLAKCCEAALLRKEYPVAFGGAYIREEMPAEEGTPSRAEVVLSATGGEPPKQEAPALPPPPPTVGFGQWKGRAIAELTTDEKQAALVYAQENLAKHPKMGAKTRAALEGNMEALRASLAETQAAPKPEPEDAHFEPHPDGEPPDGERLPGMEG